ncbi:hypothetical protein EGJ61_23435 [Klebsiella quasipneumoniae]|uniref:Uncharacterized protein n=1 Tax=Raoultella ornithinolytica TaxID=54291 RepID=A0A1V0M3A9_RAOOR|nr:Hypothetical protein [Raoultella ornithinolytica]ARV43033.1 hypothetical protein RJA_28240 [Klebsiella pneumoniae subsp. pneumoniae]ASG37033.1 hypothetical protein CES89_26860 [Klebsiella pneumoniae]AWD06580.1 hypothetical protein AM407_27245 [Klebsiella aerogenes]KYT22223.1 hypothetical protein AML48_22985 [Escherichia coli]MCU7510841.1 hypothetical protein [Klebsiella quasipneumoniae]OZQ42857.1 hypothetical protein CIG61_27675 [Klebsiella variicola]QHO84563.1 hypothetical protein CHQ91_
MFLIGQLVYTYPGKLTHKRSAAFLASACTAGPQLTAMAHSRRNDAVCRLLKEDDSQLRAQP